MSDLSGIQKIIYSDDTTNTSMDQRAERKDPSLAIDTVDRAVRVMLDNERNEDGYKYEESYIYNLNADDIGPGLGWECLRLERAVVEDETGYVPTVNVYLVSADGKTEELVHGTEKGSAEWVYDKEKIEKFAKDCCTKDGGRGFVSTIDLGLTNPKVDVPPKPVVTTVDADNFMNLLEEKGISEAFYDITEEQGVYAELDSGFVPFEYRDQYRDIVESIREFDPCYGYIAGHDTTRTDNVEVKELTSPNEIQDFIKDFVGENPDLYDIDHVKIYIQSSDALTDGEIEGSYVPYIETEGIRLNGEQPEKLSIPVSNLVTIECHEKDIESAENPEKLTVHFIEDNISDKEEIDSSTIEEEESEVGSSNTDWLDEVGKKVEDEELEEKITENEEKEAPKTENEDIESDKEYLLEESEDKDAFEENTSGMETNIVDEMTSGKDSSADNDNNSEKVEDTDLGKTEEHMEDDVKENKMIPTGDIDKKNADKEEKREILLSREEKALKDKLENLPDTISSNQVSSDPDVKGLIGDIRKTAGGQNISDPIAKVVASLSIDKEKNDISDKKTKNICKGMESITKADGASVKIKNIIVKARNIIKDYQKPLGIVSPETRVLMTLSDRFTNYIESKIPLAAVRMDIKAYHDNFSGNISGFLSNVSKALGDTIDKYKMELKEKNALVVSRIDNIMNSISSVTGIDIDKAGAVIKDTIKGISIGVTKGIIAFFSYDPIVSPIEKQEESKPEDIEKNEEVTINDKETEWRATPNVTIMDADKTDSDLNENHKENIEQMSSDKISMAVDAEESMNNHLKEDNTEKEEIENLSPLKEDNVTNNKQLNEKNDSISMKKNNKTQETMIETNGSNNIEKIMEDTFHGETTVSPDKDHIIDNTPVQEDSLYLS